MQKIINITPHSEVAMEGAQKVFSIMTGVLLLVFLMTSTVLLTDTKDLMASFEVCLATTIIALLLLAAITLSLAFLGKRLQDRLIPTCGLLILATISSGLLSSLLAIKFPETTAPLLLALGITVVTTILTTSIKSCCSLPPKPWRSWLTLPAVFAGVLLLVLAWVSLVDPDYALTICPRDVLYGGLGALDMLVFLSLGTSWLLENKFDNPLLTALVLISSFLWYHLLILIVAAACFLGAGEGCEGGGDCCNFDCGNSDCGGCGDCGNFDCDGCGAFWTSFGHCGIGGRNPQRTQGQVEEV